MGSDNNFEVEVVVRSTFTYYCWTMWVHSYNGSSGQFGDSSWDSRLTHWNTVSPWYVCSSRSSSITITSPTNSLDLDYFVLMFSMLQKVFTSVPCLVFSTQACNSAFIPNRTLTIYFDQYGQFGTILCFCNCDFINRRSDNFNWLQLLIWSFRVSHSTANLPVNFITWHRQQLNQ